MGWNHLPRGLGFLAAPTMVSLLSEYEPTEADRKRWANDRARRRHEQEMNERGRGERIRKAEKKRARKAAKLLKERNR